MLFHFPAPYLIRIATVALCAVMALGAQALNGFDLHGSTVPADEIFEGGPPRDGIPSIDSPVFAAASSDSAGFLDDEDLVLGLAHGGEARAYPVKILNWHEIVNDNIGGDPVAVTYCPLCGSGVVFRSEVAGRRLTFGVSGLLYNSDVLLYDRETESLWSQLLRSAVTGEYNETPLASLPVQHTTWKHWREQHPDTQVLTRDTGEFRDYDRDPYDGYRATARLIFPTNPPAPDVMHPKAWVLGVAHGGEAKAYPLLELQKNGSSEVRDSVGGEDLTIHWNEEAQSARAEWDGSSGESVRAFWFAWAAFHPETEVYQAP